MPNMGGYAFPYSYKPANAAKTHVANENFNCSECPYMRLNTLEKVYRCLADESPEIIIPEEIRKRALLPLERMLALG